MARPWEADPRADFKRRLGASPSDTGASQDEVDCPDMWELDNGDIAIIGRDLTEVYQSRLPNGVRIGNDERLVIFPGRMLSAAKPDIPDA
ncbi:hypothetical protein [Sinosporangium siamense]|uniref:Uncharacterized protein n=1 Tax=Sinosporangium siamense TaxID=1367973 RepID=A0A919V895_9ACTN|nr:hypothetical protein [Sinosporangium siamense]GII92972.1 hypothetical protein Ssi02_32030 [Sinosporangium siamense]